MFGSGPGAAYGVRVVTAQARAHTSDRRATAQPYPRRASGGSAAGPPGPGRRSALRRPSRVDGAGGRGRGQTGAAEPGGAPGAPAGPQDAAAGAPGGARGAARLRRPGQRAADHPGDLGSGPARGLAGGRGRDRGARPQRRGERRDRAQRRHQRLREGGPLAGGPATPRGDVPRPPRVRRHRLRRHHKRLREVRAVAGGARRARRCVALRDFKDAVYPFFESDTLFLDFHFVLFLVVW